MYFIPGKGAKYCDQRVCMSVRPLTYVKNHMSRLHEIFTSPEGAVAKYCDDNMCLCVCLSWRISPEPHARSLPNFCSCCPCLWLGPPPACWRSPIGGKGLRECTARAKCNLRLLCLYMLPVSVARSSSDDNAITLCTSGLWMTSCFHVMGKYRYTLVVSLRRSQLLPWLDHNVTPLNCAPGDEVCYPRLPCCLCDNNTACVFLYCVHCTAHVDMLYSSTLSVICLHCVYVQYHQFFLYWWHIIDGIFANICRSVVCCFASMLDHGLHAVRRM